MNGPGERVLSQYMKAEEKEIRRYMERRGMSRSEVEGDLQKVKTEHIDEETKKSIQEITGLRAKMGGAERMDLLGVKPSVFAKELTFIDKSFVDEITPLEILTFDPKAPDFATRSPNFHAYLRFTEGLSRMVPHAYKVLRERAQGAAYAESLQTRQPKASPELPERFSNRKYISCKTNVLYDIGELSTGDQIKAENQKGAEGNAQVQKYFVNVIRELEKLNNANGIKALTKGLKRTKLKRRDLERIVEAQGRGPSIQDKEKRDELQKARKIYIHDVHVIEEDLFEVYVDKGNEASGDKFRKIVEYFDYVRNFPAREKVDRSINHKIISMINSSEDVRTERHEEACQIDYEGFFIFGGYSLFA